MICSCAVQLTQRERDSLRTHTQGCATWRPVDGKQAAIWGLQDIASYGGVGADSTTTTTHASATHALSNAIVKSAILLEHKSSFKVHPSSRKNDVSRKDPKHQI